jgi:homoserine dehydrogenase
VVTANKELIAAHGPALLQLSRRRGARLDFEAAVAGAIPVVRTVRAGAGGVAVRRISAILNGTSNFVLDRLAAGDSLADAVAEAQRLGYAEADPTRDLSGEDVEAKLRILAWLAFRVDPATLEIDRQGIDAGTAVWAAQVTAHGDRVKLIATCERVGEQLVASIRPVQVKGDSEWAAVRGAQNRIEIESESAGLIVLQGAGAGGRATAGAMLGDVFNSVAGGYAFDASAANQ